MDMPLGDRRFIMSSADRTAAVPALVVTPPVHPLPAGTPRRDEPVRVVVHAADPLDAAGLAAILRGRGLDTVPADGAPRRPGTTGAARGDVLVVAAAPDLATTVAWLRGQDLTASLPTVVVAHREPPPELLAACGGRVVLAAPRSAAGTEQFARLVEAAAVGQGWTAPAERHLAAFYRHLEQQHRPPRRLTDDEAELLRLAADGFTPAEIARRTGRSPATVRLILSGLVERLQLRNLRHAIAYAIRAGELP